MKSGRVLKVGNPNRPGDGTPFGTLSNDPQARYSLNHAQAADEWRTRSGTDDEGLQPALSEISVSTELFLYLNEHFGEEMSAVRRLSTWPITRAFVYLDISDFSKLPTGIQLFVIESLIRLSNQAEDDISGKAEAKLCIGDGYIYVWDEAVGATRFAGYLAREIEKAVSEKRAPEFHFRIGVHVGPVRCFWDPGRDDWNYVGDGINGGNRVLSAIGKETRRRCIRLR
jgi:class 3 adenylate cyclase